MNRIILLLKKQKVLQLEVERDGWNTEKKIINIFLVSKNVTEKKKH